MIFQFAGDFFSDRTHHIGFHLSTFTDLCIGQIEAPTCPPGIWLFENYCSNNKNWETLLAYLLRAKVSCKAAEIAATRSLKAQSFFVCHATYKAFFKKIPPIEITTSWQIHWHASSLTWIAGIGIVIRYKHNLIHSFIQSLNPILKILEFN